MNSAENDFVEVEDSVRDQKHDILTIFDLAKKHWDKFISRNSMHRAVISQR